MSNATLKAGQKRIRLAPRVLSWTLLVIAMLATIWALATNKSEQIGPSVVINSQTLAVEVVDTEAARTQGLSDRKSLAENRGMLFKFEENTGHCFWMKDMRFAIDIVWLDAYGEVVHIAEEITPETYPESFCSDEDARYVLEVNAGVAEQLDITEDTRIELRL